MRFFFFLICNRLERERRNKLQKEQKKRERKGEQKWESRQHLACAWWNWWRRKHHLVLSRVGQVSSQDGGAAAVGPQEKTSGSGNTCFGQTEGLSSHHCWVMGSAKGRIVKAGSLHCPSRNLDYIYFYPVLELVIYSRIRDLHSKVYIDTITLKWLVYSHDFHLDPLYEQS